jgi:peptidoglycan/xylan/chitin deacetylase (PgdA/CDA1 family)
MLNTTDRSFQSSPLIWPNGKQSAAALAFDLDGPTGDAMLDGSLVKNLRYFTEGAYGPWKALPRVLDLLREYDLTATFFVPTWVVLHWTEACESILLCGHEIAYHGHRHECFVDLALLEQLEVMQTSRALFIKHLGVVPTGFRTPSGDWTKNTADLLHDFGLLYSSSMRNDDRPYFHKRQDGTCGLVEIPGRSDMDDYTSLAYFEGPDFPIGLDRISPYENVLRNWCHEFEGYHREGLCWTSILHPKVCAKPGRMTILEGLFECIARQDSVWVAKCSEIASWWTTQYSPNPCEALAS